MNVCCNCLAETSEEKCQHCPAQAVVPVFVFLDGCSLDELIAARDHWISLAKFFEPETQMWKERLVRFDSWIDRVKRSREERQPAKDLCEAN
jgi:hypothetical protein